MKLQIQTTIALAVGLLFWSAAAHAAAFLDNFDTPHDYLTNGTAGTIWDGFFYNFGGHGNATVAVADAGISHPGKLTIISANGGWEGSRDDGVFLFKTVAGDFDARIRIVSMNILNDHDAGLMARVAAPDASHESYVAVRYYAPGDFNSTRNTVNGEGVGDVDIPRPAQPWLRLTRVGHDLTSWRSTDGKAWTRMTGFTRLDLNGLPLQVGIWQGTFNHRRGIALFDQFTLFTGRSTTTLLTITRPDSRAGGSFTMAARVKTEGLTATNSQGSVVFNVDGTPTATYSVTGGRAVLSLRDLAPGQHTIMAEYGGDSLYLPSPSAPTNIIVDGEPGGRPPRK